MFSIWDRESGNLVAWFDTEQEAKDFIALCVEEDPRDAEVLGIINEDNLPG